VSDEWRRAREQRANRELADVIAAAWRSRFGKVAVVVEPVLAEMRRRDD
jgi:hypothetical protein